ncbi:MAG: cheR [Dehalococcoidia bacterium]|nr:cheR [Dehalococcoidia bacterium]
MNDQEFDYLKQRILALAGIDLECYKSQQMRRRLEAFIAAQGMDTIPFCSVLARDPGALAKLRDFLTINVTEFFRDREQYQVLRTVILPKLLRRTDRLNIWSAGCSRGAEAYSTAMILQEISPGQAHRTLATDIDEGVLAVARKGGPYSPSDLKNVDRSLLLKYFTKSEEDLMVAPAIRRRVEFRKHNLLSDRFEPGFDLIICRNVTIYFSDGAKTKLLQGFHSSLKEQGVLFIGATETLLSAPSLGFEWIGKCFYRKSASSRLPQAQEAAAPLPRAVEGR